MAFSTPFYAFAAAAAWYKIPHTDEASLGWFYVLAALVSIGFTFQNAPSMGLFTKLMTGSEFEGLASSVALQAQGLGRVLGPLIAGVTLDNGGIKVAVMVLLVMLAIQTATIVLNWKRMEFEPNGLVSSHFSDYEINTSQIFHTPDCTPPASPSASFSGCEKLLGDADQYDEEAAQLVGSPSADDIPNLSGKWKHTHDDTAAMDRLLEASGVNWFSRKAFKIFHPELKIDQNGDSFDVHLKAAAGESHDKFKVGDQFVQYDASLKKDCTYASRWEREPGRPVKFHQLNVEMPKRGLRRWLETTGKGVYLVQELEIETGLRAKRYFTRQT